MKKYLTNLSSRRGERNKAKSEVFISDVQKIESQRGEAKPIARSVRNSTKKELGR